MGPLPLYYDTAAVRAQGAQKLCYIFAHSLGLVNQAAEAAGEQAVLHHED